MINQATKHRPSTNFFQETFIDTYQISNNHLKNKRMAKTLRDVKRGLHFKNKVYFIKDFF